MKMYVVGTHKKRLGEALLMSTNNIHFQGENINSFEKKKCVLSGVVNKRHYLNLIIRLIYTPLEEQQVGAEQSRSIGMVPR